MGTTDNRALRRGFIAVTGTMTLAHPFLPVEVRTVTFLLVSACTVVPLAVLVRHQRPQDRRSWTMLLIAMIVLTAGNAVTAFGNPAHRLNSEIIVTIGHAMLLASAITLALRRGRNDLGGLLDISVGAIGLCGIVWTLLLFPRLIAMGAAIGEQIALLISIFVLAGVLGALIRIYLTSERRLVALGLLASALLLALIGNIVMAMSNGTMTTDRPGGIELFFLVAYMCVGIAPLHASVHELARPGPPPADRQSVGRLVFLGVALAINPIVGGVREMLGHEADGPLLAIGSLFVVPLVMMRVGRLAGQRARAERALLHQATHDTLTGLPNRAELLSRLEAGLARERITGRPDVVLLFCDLNGFKAVNDRLGHLAGDQLLIEVGVRIRAGLRAGDTLARYGGDEFLVLCEEPAQRQAVARLCEHVAAALEPPFLLAGENVRISSSVGAVISDGSTGADELITSADQAMYRAKQRHRADATA